ncbi:MAG: hypothetical protein V3575_06570 [Candidatus Absconditabacteria bacterium]
MTKKDNEEYLKFIDYNSKGETIKAYKVIEKLYKNHPNFFRIKYNYYVCKSNYISRCKYTNISQFKLSKIPIEEKLQDIDFLEKEFFQELEQMKIEKPDYPMRKTNRINKQDVLDFMKEFKKYLLD